MAIRALIRENKTHQIYSIMDSQRGSGMQSMELAIQKAVQGKFITPREAQEVRNRVGVVLPSQQTNRPTTYNRR